jgi:hypothetical protein
MRIFHKMDGVDETFQRIRDTLPHIQTTSVPSPNTYNCRCGREEMK